MTRRTRTLATVLAALALAACGREATPEPGASSSPSGSATASTTTSATPTASSSPARMLVAVYYLGDTKIGPRLYREFRKVPKSTGTVRAAVDAMLHLTPEDPDYRSVWPRASAVRGVTISGETATVDLSTDARRATAGADVERQSLQQLVHTVTAAASAVKAVQLLVDGKKVETLWGHVDTRNPIRRMPGVDTLAPVWVVTPSHNAPVSRSLEVNGVATVFEANVSWSLTYPCAAGQACREIAKGFVTASVGAPGRGTWKVRTTIPANVSGPVVFTAWESSAEDGSVTFPDSKTYRVG